MPLKPLALLLKPHILYLYLCICVFVFVYLCICVFVYLHICIINWCTEEEKLHDQIVLFQPLFLNLILDISFEYFQPQRVLIKNWTCKTKITRNWSKNFHFHRRCKSFWGKFYQKLSCKSPVASSLTCPCLEPKDGHQSLHHLDGRLTTMLPTV